jgi:hypothetical protein
MDNINTLTFASLYENIDSSINKFPFFTNGHGNLFIIRDAGIPIVEPCEEKRQYYCKPTISDCTALVLVPDNEQKKSIPMSSSIANIVDMLESRRTSDGHSVVTKRIRAKEQGIVIKVKKNQEKNESNDLKEEENKSKTNEKTNQHVDVQDFIIEDGEEEFGPLI